LNDIFEPLRKLTPRTGTSEVASVGSVQLSTDYLSAFKVPVITTTTTTATSTEALEIDISATASSTKIETEVEVIATSTTTSTPTIITPAAPVYNGWTPHLMTIPRINVQ